MGQHAVNIRLSHEADLPRELHSDHLFVAVCLTNKDLYIVYPQPRLLTVPIATPQLAS